MKISNDTIKLMQNFASINGNLHIRPGTELATISPNKTIFAKATVSDDFPQDCCIYELGSLLSLLTLMEDQDIDFGDKSLTVSKDGGKFEYFYAEENVIIAPEAGKSIPVDNHYEFDLSKADIETLNKAAAIVGAKFVNLVGKGGKVTLSIGDPKVATANSYKRQLPDSEHEFNGLIAIENFKMIPDAYKVTLSKKKFLHFKHTTKDLQYWIVMEKDSTV